MLLVDGAMLPKLHGQKHQRLDGGGVPGRAHRPGYAVVPRIERPLIERLRFLRVPRPARPTPAAPAGVAPAQRPTPAHHPTGKRYRLLRSRCTRRGGWKNALRRCAGAWGTWWTFPSIPPPSASSTFQQGGQRRRPIASVFAVTARRAVGCMRASSTAPGCRSRRHRHSRLAQHPTSPPPLRRASRGLAFLSLGETDNLLTITYRRRALSRPHRNRFPPHPGRGRGRAAPGLGRAPRPRTAAHPRDNFDRQQFYFRRPPGAPASSPPTGSRRHRRKPRPIADRHGSGGGGRFSRPAGRESPAPEPGACLAIGAALRGGRSMSQQINLPCPPCGPAAIGWAFRWWRGRPWPSSCSSPAWGFGGGSRWPAWAGKSAGRRRRPPGNASWRWGRPSPPASPARRLRPRSTAWRIPARQQKPYQGGKVRPGPAGGSPLLAMRGFARQMVDGVWLTGFTLAGGDVKSAAGWLTRLAAPTIAASAESAFQGRRFRRRHYGTPAPPPGNAGPRCRRRERPALLQFVSRGSQGPGGGKTRRLCKTPWPASLPATPFPRAGRWSPSLVFGRCWWAIRSLSIRHSPDPQPSPGSRAAARSAQPAPRMQIANLEAQLGRPRRPQSQDSRRAAETPGGRRAPEKLSDSLVPPAEMNHLLDICWPSTAACASSTKTLAPESILAPPPGGGQTAERQFDIFPSRHRICAWRPLVFGLLPRPARKGRRNCSGAGRLTVRRIPRPCSRSRSPWPPIGRSCRYEAADSPCHSGRCLNRRRRRRRRALGDRPAAGRNSAGRRAEPAEPACVYNQCFCRKSSKPTAIISGKLVALSGRSRRGRLVQLSETETVLARAGASSVWP